MKIDRSKLKKSSSEVPLDCKGLIDTLTSCCKQDFLGELKKIETWTYGKCELLHWIDVLDRCDDVLESACAREPNSWVLACDTTDGSGRLKELVLWTLHFTTLLIEHSFSRHLYSSMEHLTTLLSSSDLDVVLAVLNLLYMFSKRSNFITRLAPEKRQILLNRLTHLAASWGGRDNGFGLSKCCSDDDINTFPDSATTLHFEFYAEQNAETSSSSKRSTTSSVIVIHMEHVDQIKNSPAHIMETLLTKYPVPEEKQMLLFTYLRLAHSFSNYSKRLKCVQARLQALSVLIYSNQLTDNVQSLLYPGLLEELVEVLEMQGENLMEIKAAALKSLTSIIHLDRNPNFPKLNTIIDVTGAGSYHGFLPVMVRNCIMSLTGTSPNNDMASQPFPQPLATALFSFLYHLASYEAGGEALVSCGMMESLLKVIQWPSTELDHITFVTRAVRVIDLITNLDMQSFQTHQGLTSFIGRLELEVEHCRKQQPFQIQVGPVRRDSLTEALEGRSGEEEAMEVDEQPNTTDAVPDYSAAKTGLTCLPQRAALLKSMLNFLKKAIQDPAFSDSIRHVMDGSLPESLKHIISNAEYYGPSLFLLATDVVTAYVFQEPSLLSSLQDKGLTDVVLHALLVKDVPATREVLGSLPNVFSALCLNTRGLDAFVACKPFERLFKVLLSPDYLPAMRRRRSSDPMGDTASNLGNAMDELMRHQPSLKQAATGAIIKLLEEVCALGRDPKYICWKSQPKPEQVLTPPVQPNNTGEGASSDEEDEEEEEGNVANGQAAPPQEQQPMPSPEKEAVPLVDYIHNVMKFVDAILSNNSTDDHCREFVQQKGLVPLMGILGLPNLPIDFPAQPACQAVAAVCKSILNLAHEPQVLKQGLLHLNDVLKNLEPLHTPLEPPGGSVLLHELVSAPNISEATSNPQTTPLLHHMAAAHAYIQMFVHVCRTGQSDIRTISISHWGSELGLSVLKGLSRLYTSLVWESTVLLALCSEDTLPAGCEFGKADMDKLLPPNITADTKGAENEETLSPSSGISADSNSSVTMAMENLSTDPVTAMDVESTAVEVKQSKEKCSPALHHQIKQIKPLLSGSSRLGRALAELFALLVKLCVGSPLRQRRGQQIPPTPAPPSPPARAVASALTKLLASGLSWEPPATSPIPRFRLTFYICSVGFTAPMLFDEKKYPFHLMLMKFMTSGGQKAFFDTFDWALSCGGRIPPEQGLESPDLPDGTGEFLDSWLMLLEKMVNPKAVLESPHTLPAKQTGNFKPFDPMKYLVRTHKLAFQAVMKLWNKRPLKVYGAHMSELVLSILCHILKGEKLVVEKMEKEKEVAKPPLIPETTASTAGASANSAGISSNNENSQAGMSTAGAGIATANNEPSEPGINPEHLQRLMDMGFPRERCIEAIQSTPTIEQATDFLLSNPIAPLGQVFGGSGLGEQDDLMRAIAMSLGENVIMSTDQQGDNPEQRREQEEEEESMREDEESLSKEVIDEFTEEALAGCLSLLDTLPETVYKVCDLLLAIFNRDGVAFKERVLKRLIDQVRETVDSLMGLVNPLTNQLSGDPKRLTKNPKPPEQYEALHEKLINCDDTKRAAARIHLFTLLFEECKLLCAKIVEESQVVKLMTPLLYNTYKLLHHVEYQIGKAVETPKWMTPMLLFIDLNEKVVLGMNRRAALTKVCSHSWRWFDVSSGKWCPYAQPNNKTIDDAFWAGETNVRIQTGRRKYNIKFGSMMQANEETGNQRPIMISLKTKQSDNEKRDMEMEQEVANLVDTPPQPEDEPSFSGAEGLNIEQGRLLLRACIGLVSVPVDPDALNAVLRLCLRLTQDFNRAILFTQLGGVKLLLDLTQASSFSGFASLTTLLIRHVMEDPATLKHTMEKVIRSSTATSNASNTKELHYLLRMLAPAACRAPSIFAEVARDVLRVDLNLLNKRGEPEDDPRLLVKSLPAKPATAPIAQEVSQTVIRELLNFLVQVFPEEEEKTENENSTAQASTTSTSQQQQQRVVPFEEMASTVQGAAHRHRIIMRNSSSGELQVPMAENSVPTEPKEDKAPSTTKKEDQSKRRPLLSKSMVCKLLAELVKSYGGCAKMITDHMYEAGMTDLINDDMSALSFLLDELLTNKTDKDSAQYVKTLVAALASCNQYPDAQGTLVIEVKSALARALVFPESPMKHTKIQALTGLISTMIESCPSSVQHHSTPYKQQQYHMNNIVKMMLKRGLITDLARVPHSLDLSSPGVAATINAALKPLETLSRIVNQPTSLPTSRPVKHKAETNETAESNVQECGTNTTNSEATRAQGDEVVEQDAEATEHDVSTAAESMDPNSESQLQTVEEGNAEEFDEMMEQLLEHDGGAQEQIIAEVIHENRNHEADETHDSQMLTQDESHFEAQQMSQDEEDHESDSSHSANSDQDDGMEEEDAEDEEDGEEEEEEEDEDDDDDGESPFDEENDDFQELEDAAIYRFPLADHDHDEIDLMIHYPDPDNALHIDGNGGRDGSRAIHLPLWSDVNGVGGGGGVIETGGGNAPSHVTPTHPLLMGRHVVEASTGARGGGGSSRTLQRHRGFRGFIHLNSRGQNNPSAPAILQNFLGTDAGNLLATQGLRARTPLLVDFGYAILDSLENEMPDLDGGVLGSGGRACLSAIPSALVRWNEESRVIDGDSMHDCVTALKPDILEIIERVKEEELSERRAKKKKQQEEEEAKRKATKKDEEPEVAAAAAPAAATPATTENTIEDVLAENPATTTSSGEVTVSRISGMELLNMTRAAVSELQAGPPEMQREPSDQRSVAAQLADGLIAAISSRSSQEQSRQEPSTSEEQPPTTSESQQASSGRPDYLLPSSLFSSSLQNIGDLVTPFSFSNNPPPPPFPTIPIPPTNSDISVPIPTSVAPSSASEQPEPEVLPAALAPLSPSPDQDPQQQAAGNDQDVSMNSEPGTSETPMAGTSSGEAHAGGPDYSAILGNIEIPEGVDPSFLAALPEDMRQEVIDDQRRLANIRRRAQDASATEGIGEVTEEFLAALPPNIQEEVLAQQRIEQQRRQAQQNPEAPVDPTEFFQTLPASLRQSVLADMEESQMSALPPDLAAEAQTIRREFEQRNRAMMHERFFSHVNQSGSALSSILRNTVNRLGSQYVISSLPGSGRDWRPGYNRTGHPASLMASASALRFRGKQLLDHEGLSCLLILLFIDDPKINTTRLHRILRNLCYHAPTRDWVIRSLLSILEKANEGTRQDETIPDAPTTAKLRKGNAKSETTKTSIPSWLNLSMDAALGFRANVFQVTKSQSTGGKRSSTINSAEKQSQTSSAVNIHPGASALVCRHTLEVLISLAKSFPVHFLPWKDIEQGARESTSSESKSKQNSSTTKTKTDANVSIDFWDTLLKLDQQSGSRKGKSVARSHSSVSGFKSETEEEFLCFENSPFGQLLGMLSNPVIRRSSVLTDKLLRLLSLISLGQPDIYKRPASNEKKPEGATTSSSNDTNSISRNHLRLAVDVLTSKACSEEGLEDVTALLLNLSYGPAPTRDTILSLLLQGAQELGGVVRQNILDLKRELEMYKRKAQQLAEEEGDDLSSDQKRSGAIVDRFTKETVVLTAPLKVKGGELQLPSMNTLTNKTSSQAFFLRVLKVIIQLREAALLAMKKSKALAEQEQKDKAAASQQETSAAAPGEEESVPENATSTPAVAAAPAVEPVVRLPSNVDEMEIEIVQHDVSAAGAANSDPVVEEQPVEVEGLEPLSEQLNLTALWDALSSCLKDLADTSDHHAVLVLQATVEAFFLVHSAATQPDEKRKIHYKETRQEQLAHILETPQLKTAQTEEGEAVSHQPESLLSQTSVDKSAVVKELSKETKKFLDFAETHRTVLNQILRQSTTHLSDGPFSVLVDHTRVLDFDIKRRYFRTELERMDEGIRREDLAVHVKRENVFEDSFRELHRRSPEEWKNRFYIVFEGEEGQDAGGLLREWYVIISREIFNPMYALFKVSPGDKVTYMIYESSQTNPNHLDYFKFVGRVIAKAIYDNKLLECYFTRSFYKHILARTVKYTDMESEDFEFYRGLEFLTNNKVEDIGYDLTFSVEIQEFGVTEVRDLIPNGRNIRVTEDNKMDYIRLVCQMKMTGAIRKQLAAFLEGFYSIIPRRLISIFNEQELELLLSGLPTIDIDDLKANTEYHKYQANSLHIVWFWRALRSFDQTDKAKFMQFVTGSSKVPLQGFAALEGMNGPQKFQIHRDDRSTDRLPSAHTCFNQLDLPAYETYDKLRTYLLKAVQECSEGFGFA